MSEAGPPSGQEAPHPGEANHRRVDREGPDDVSPAADLLTVSGRRLDAVEASSGGERRALGYLGQVLVEKHAGDQLLA
jgi:hypothetical protein